MQLWSGRAVTAAREDRGCGSRLSRVDKSTKSRGRTLDGGMAVVNRIIKDKAAVLLIFDQTPWHYLGQLLSRLRRRSTSVHLLPIWRPRA
jgi:hypothetical protein